MTSINVHDKVSNMQEHVASAMESVTSKVTDFFQGNPFETPIGRKIESATDATKLATENWGLNMEICDFINNTNEGGRDAIRAIRKRLQTQMGKNNAIVMYTLTLLETCVKNCNQQFKALVCQKDFINELVKLIGAKFDAPQIIQERVLGLIQSWADAFRGNPALTSVAEVYDELKSKGVEFPAMDLDSMAPIITPRRTIFQNSTNSTDAPTKPPPQPRPSTVETAQASQRTAQRAENYSIVDPNQGPVAATPDQLAKLRSELDIANVNLTVLRELLGVLSPNRENATDFELLQQLYYTCQEMQKRVFELIPLITNEEVTYELLTINDEFNTIFKKYNRYMTNRGAQSGPSTAPTPGDLIDLGNSGNGGGGSSASLLSKGVSNISLQGSVASAESSAARPSGPSNESYVHDQTEAGLRTAAFNKTQTISDREAQEIAGWLEKSSAEHRKGEPRAAKDDDASNDGL